jgi:hypothetical protein
MRFGRYAVVEDPQVNPASALTLADVPAARKF